VRLNSKGQVTIPSALRARNQLHEGDEVEVVADEGSLRIIRREGGRTRGRVPARSMRGRATTTLSTDELTDLVRGE
jgi:AbrB family looped-hinge helix DNA binding protein